MKLWREAWREGFAPGISPAALLAIRKGLLQDDPRMIQGATCSPPPMQAVQDWPVEAADILVYGFWIGDSDGLCEVGEAEEYFARSCYKCDHRIGGPEFSGHFLNWYDETPRDHMRKLMLPEVNVALSRNFSEEAKIIVESMQSAPMLVVADRLNDAGLEKEEAIIRLMAAE